MLCSKPKAELLLGHFSVRSECIKQENVGIPHMIRSKYRGSSQAQSSQLLYVGVLNTLPAFTYSRYFSCLLLPPPSLKAGAQVARE